MQFREAETTSRSLCIALPFMCTSSSRVEYPRTLFLLSGGSCLTCIEIYSVFPSNDAPVETRYNKPIGLCCVYRIDVHVLY
jgi:hypothetical protein